MHALESDEVMALARQVRALSPEVPIVIGGHTAAAYPSRSSRPMSPRSCWTTASARCRRSVTPSSVARR